MPYSLTGSCTGDSLVGCRCSQTRLATVTARPSRARIPAAAIRGPSLARRALAASSADASSCQQQYPCRAHPLASPRVRPGARDAVGGRRRQIAAVYLKTALLLGGLGTVAGIVLGAVLAYILTRFLGSTLFAVGVGFGIDWPIVLASALVGLLGPPLAAPPAIRRAVRVPVRDALEATGSAAGGQDAGDRLLRRVRFLPRPAPGSVTSSSSRPPPARPAS